MTLSERAVAAIRPAEMPKADQPLSEQYRLAGEAYYDLEAAASLMENMKTTTLEQKKQKLIQTVGDMPDSHAERRVKAMSDWEAYIRDMCAARNAADLARLKMEVIRMRFSEWNSRDANSRAEMRLSK